MRARIAAISAVVVAGLGLAGPTTSAAGAPPVAASANCTINNFSPRSVVLGESPTTVKFAISTSGCSLTDWTLNDDVAAGFFADRYSPQDTFDPEILLNSNAGPSSVIATADNPDYHETQRSFDGGFDLRRRVAVRRAGPSMPRPSPSTKAEPRASSRGSSWSTGTRTPRPMSHSAGTRSPCNSARHRGRTRR
jgi:hypothetical protein